MYHARTPEVPPRVVTDTRLRVTDRQGGLHLLTPTELTSTPREDAAESFIESAFSSSNPDRQSAREHLVFLAEGALGGLDVASIEALEQSWKVDPYATPPLDRSAPVREVVTGRLTEGVEKPAQVTP